MNQNHNIIFGSYNLNLWSCILEHTLAYSILSYLLSSKLQGNCSKHILVKQVQPHNFERKIKEKSDENKDVNWCILIWSLSKPKSITIRRRNDEREKASSSSIEESR